MNKTYCVLPWVSIAVDPDGSVKPCCISLDSIKKPDGTKFNLGTDKIEEIYNSPHYLGIRQKMLAGDKVPGCDRCYRMEEYGEKSHRKAYNEAYKQSISDAVVVNPIIQYFDLRFGNLCNLACRSCSPNNSSQLAKEVNEITGLQKFHSKYKLKTIEWYETQVYEENINDQLHNVKLLYMTGGEPTIIQKNFDTMSRLIELGYSKNIVLKFNSNMTNSNPKFYDLLGKFKAVIFFASIDGFESMQEYLRYPSSWKQLHMNLCKLLTLGPTIHIKPSPVIQLTNLNKIVDLFEYFENQNRVLGRCVFEMTPILLEYPDFLNLDCLPLDFKIMSWKRIEDWITTKCRFQKATFHTTMQALKTKCYEDHTTNILLDNYIEYNSIFDNHRNHHLIDVNPELHAILHK